MRPVSELSQSLPRVTATLDSPVINLVIHRLTSQRNVLRSCSRVEGYLRTHLRGYVEMVVHVTLVTDMVTADSESERGDVVSMGSRLVAVKTILGCVNHLRCLGALAPLLSRTRGR